MAERPRMTAADLVDKLLADEHADVLRDSVAWLVTQLMEAEVGGLTGAGLGERAPERRRAQRNGHRPRLLSTTAGDVELRIAKLAMRCVKRRLGPVSGHRGVAAQRVGLGRRPGGRGLHELAVGLGGSSRPHADGLASEVMASTRCIRGLEEARGAGRRAWDEVEPHSYVGVWPAPRRPIASLGSAGLTTRLPHGQLRRNAGRTVAPPTGGLVAGIVVGAGEHQRKTGPANRVAGGGERHQRWLAVEVDAPLVGVAPPARRRAGHRRARCSRRHPRPEQGGRHDLPRRPWQRIHLGRLHRRLPAARAAPLDEPHRLVPGQRRRRGLVRLVEGRAGPPGALPHPVRGPRRHPPLDRLVQPLPAALDPRLPTTHRMGTAPRHHQPATIDHARTTPVSTSRGEVHRRASTGWPSTLLHAPPVATGCPGSRRRPALDGGGPISVAPRACVGRMGAEAAWLA
jgi:Transposase, Mutator family